MKSDYRTGDKLTVQRRLTMRRRVFVWSGILAMGLAACGPAAEHATPTATTAIPTATATEATAIPATPTPTPTPAPKAAPTTASQYGGVVKARLRTDSGTFDLQAEVESSGSFVSHLVHGVYAYRGGNCSQDSIPSAAKKWGWRDDLTFDIELQQGMKFHNKPPVNGREVTADDAVFSINRFRQVKPLGGTGIAMLKEDVTSVEAADRYRVVVRTKTPQPALASEAFLVNARGARLILAPEVWGRVKGWADPYETLVGSGPFMFERYLPGVKMVVTRNPDYWKKGLPYVDSIEAVVIGETSTTLAALRSGALNMWTQFADRQSARALEGNKDMKVYRCPGLRTNNILMRWDKPPFNDVRVRRAVSMAIDRDILLKSILEGDGVIAAVSPTGTPGALTRDELPPEVRRYFEYNPEEAKRLLKEAGYAGGLKGITLEYLRRGWPWDQFNEAVQEMLNRAGIETTLVPLVTAVYNSKRIAPFPYDYILIGQTTGGDPIVEAMAFDGRGRGANRQNISDPVIQPLVDEYVTLFPGPRTEELYRQIQIRGADQIHHLMYPSPNAYAITRANIMDFNMDLFELSHPLWAERVWFK